MTKLPKLLVQAAAAAAVGVSGLAIGVGVASGQSTAWLHTERHCTSDGGCATFRCDLGGCRRISAWEWTSPNPGSSTYSGYFYDNSVRTIQRCNQGQCATYRCDLTGADCVRINNVNPRP